MAQSVSVPAQSNDPGACHQHDRCEFKPAWSRAAGEKNPQQSADGHGFSLRTGKFSPIIVWPPSYTFDSLK